MRNNDLPASYNGPSESSIPIPAIPTSWNTFHNTNRNGVAVFLTDTTSSWLGIAHAFKSFGIPFTLCTDINEAIVNPVVFVYPIVSGKVLSSIQIDVLKKYTEKGGVLIASEVLGALSDFCGLANSVASSKRFTASLNSKEPLLRSFTVGEDTLVFGDRTSFQSIFGTYGYTINKARSLIQYDDKTSLLTLCPQGNGKTYSLGIDLGDFCQRCYNSRLYGGASTYVNGYLPTLDVLIRIIRKIYEESTPKFVTVGTVPFNKSLTICITHDVDFTTSLINAVDYSVFEKQEQVPATYFIQTKYIKDYNDEIFFNSERIEDIRKIFANGMEIASHTVSHSRSFANFIYGSGAERYADYTPFVKTEKETYNASIMGELRVSKFLLEKAIDDRQKVTTFRAGYLANPKSLPQALLSSGYLSSSNETANSVLTHLPFQLNYDRGFDQQLDIFEYPVTIEDEKSLPMLGRLNKGIEVLNSIAGYGGYANILIHTNILGEKQSFEKQVIDAFKNKAWFSTLHNFNEWWSARNAVTTFVNEEAAGITVTVNAPKAIKGLCLHISPVWHLKTAQGIRQTGEAVIIDDIRGEMKLMFSK